MASLYLHIPYCERKCFYCDFYSLENQDSILPFLDSLERELWMYHSFSIREPIETIFFGGGTPSLLPGDAISRILNSIREQYNVSKDVEISLEANPGTVDLIKLKQYQQSGINRLSYGIQSFHDDELTFLSRIHTSEQAIASVQLAQDAGFQNINIDLIFAIPGQTLERWSQNLEKARDLGTQHISAYSLIVEPNTPLFRSVQKGTVTPALTETEARMYEFTMEFLEESGFHHYEVSNYAKPGFHCRHNLNYWNGSNYLGIGPSAHSHWDSRRWWNVRNVLKYNESIGLQHLPVDGEESLYPEQKFDETIMLRLRSTGIDTRQLLVDFGVDIMKNKEQLISELTKENLMIVSESTLKLTKKGFLLCDSIIESLLKNKNSNTLPCK